LGADCGMIRTPSPIPRLAAPKPSCTHFAQIVRREKQLGSPPPRHRSSKCLPTLGRESTTPALLLVSVHVRHRADDIAHTRCPYWRPTALQDSRCSGVWVWRHVPGLFRGNDRT
jgi:hypothetical protein